MSEDYQEGDNTNRSKFAYKSVQQLSLDKLVHSVLAQARKSKPLLPTILNKKLCEHVGVECSDDTFFSLLSSMVDYCLSDIINNIKDTKEVNKYNKEALLATSDVQIQLQRREVFLCRPKVVPELGINQLNDCEMVDEDR